MIAAMMVAVLTARAQAISQQEARERVSNYLKSAPTAVRRVPAKIQLDAVAADLPHLYVFNMQEGGYVIASGDERALPVLGYSTTGSFDWDRMPENMRAWLLGYGQAIEALGDVQLTNTTARRSPLAAIEPLVQTQWSQDIVYNAQCPVYNGKAAEYQGQLCLTGCVATAMAQVMNYHKWPQTATPRIPAYTYQVGNVQEGITEQFSADALPPVTFDWNNMCDRYLTDLDSEGMLYPLNVTPAQRGAVATLMRYCGQSIHMDYSPTISLAYPIPVAEALQTYFGYDKNVRFAKRDGYSIEQWENLIYDELANNRPVIYVGTSDDGGHSFVCDGYEDGLFHINWGWEGNADNYFALSVLNPNATNVAGVAQPGIGFCIEQGAVIGIQPGKPGGETATVYPTLYNAAHFVAKEGVDYEQNPVYYLFMSYNYPGALYPEAEFEFGLFYKEGDTWKIDTAPSQKVKLKYRDNYYYFFYYYKTVDPTRVPDGTRRLYPRYRCTSVEGADWQLLAGENYYFEYTVRNGHVTITAMPSATALKVTKCEITNGTGEVAQKCNMTLTIENSGTADYEGTLMIMPINIGNQDPGEAEALSMELDELPKDWNTEAPFVSAAYVKGNSTGTVTFSFTPQRSGNYLLPILEYTGHGDIEVDPFAYSSVTILPATGISEMTAKTDAGDGAYYNLKGQRTDVPRQGIYIKNGKKVVIK